jgi:hypothetical protein
MPQCSHFITTEMRCSLTSLEGRERCDKHERKHKKKEDDAGPIKSGGCSAILVQDGKRCQRFALDGSTLCGTHERLQEKARIQREMKAAEDVLIQQRSDLFIQDQIPWRLMVQILLTEWRETTIQDRPFWQIARRVTLAQGASLDELENFYYTIREMPVLPYKQTNEPLDRLKKIALDTQNVHTSEVSSVTEKLTKLLLGQRVPESQRTLQTLTIKFSKICKIDRMSQLLATLSDINLWYEKSMCIKEGDALYRHLLDAVVSKIETSPHKISLYKRAYEETTESVGLCCQGHLSRLINIFSGFDSEFTSPVSNKEILQDKMARIAGTDISMELKIANAEGALAELQIPKEEWNSWISAL